MTSEVLHGYQEGLVQSLENRERPLYGKVAFVIGASRDIGEGENVPIMTVT